MGLKLNLSKNSLVCVDQFEDQGSLLSGILKSYLVELPFHCLGFQLGIGQSNRSYWEKLIAQVTNRLHP